jgi:hypothetical protein
MNKTRHFFFVLTVVCAYQYSFAQTNKHLFEFSSSGSYGFGRVFDGDISTYNGSNFEERITQSNLRLNFRYTALIKKNLGFGFSFTHQRFNNFTPFLSSFDYSDSNDYNNVVEMTSKESLSFDMFAPMLTIKYANKYALIPFGVEHTWGIGPAFYFLNSKTYHARYVASLSSGQTSGFTELFASDEQSAFQRYSGFNIFYNIDLNFPVTSSQFVSLGLECYVNLIRDKSYVEYEVIDQDSPPVIEAIDRWYFSSDQTQELRRRMFYSILWIKLGYKILI